MLWHLGFGAGSIAMSNDDKQGWSKGFEGAFGLERSGEKGGERGLILRRYKPVRCWGTIVPLTIIVFTTGDVFEINPSSVHT